MKQWIVTWLLFLSLFGWITGIVAGQEGPPTFYPNRAGQERPGTRPVLEQDVSAGRDILGTDSGHSYGYDYRHDSYPYQTTYHDYRSDHRPGLSSFVMTGDPISLVPHAIDLANRYGIVQCVAVLLVIFIFQYVRNTQKSAAQREEFFHNQLNYSDKRTTEELTRLSSKLGHMEQDLRALQDRFDKHAELIRTNGQLCREIVSTMTAHNLAVEQGIAELGMKFETLTAVLKRKLKGKNGEEKK